jgi:hypothetical protein
MPYQGVEARLRRSTADRKVVRGRPHDHDLAAGDGTTATAGKGKTVARRLLGTPVDARFPETGILLEIVWEGSPVTSSCCLRL